ncbi:MAG TPA: cytochrome ubiquinol oxidase subunit I [Longimicrobiales bacterium]
MDNVLAARAQMELSLAFHMIFAAIGIGLPLLMVLAEGLWLRTGQEHYRALARKWARATALTFAVGAVSGTALSFELGLLWPRFMALAGGVVGPAFALEGYAFFVEAIFIGLYFYGWERLSPRAHWLAGVAVAISGAVSGVLVVAANAWMQSPNGFRSLGGRLVAVDPLAPFKARPWLDMALHSTLSCYIATAFAVAGVYAVGQLKQRRDAYHRSGLAIALALGVVAAVLQPLSGDISARRLAVTQPAKLAAAEALFQTRRGAPLLIGGIPDESAGVTRFGVEIPYLLSLLATHDLQGEVKGLDVVPREQRPNVLVTHAAFDVMVGCGTLLALSGVLYWLVRRRRRGSGPPEPRWLLTLLALVSPLGFLALEAGWFVTEVGRQPWIIYGLMPTAEGATPVKGVPITLFGFAVLYLVLGVALAVLLRRLATGNAATAVTGNAEVAGVA